MRQTLHSLFQYQVKTQFIKPQACVWLTVAMHTVFKPAVFTFCGHSAWEPASITRDGKQ